MNGHVLELWFTLITLFWSYDQVIAKKQPIDDPDLDKNVSELIISKGYPVEEYSVVTEDGYILGVQRIPPRNRTEDTKVVLVQHGLMTASDSWVLNFPNQSLGFILSDAGYDVWLGNFRGNTYARKHKTLKPTQKEFWDFSWDDMAFKDLPATIDFILKETVKQKIYYVGHSMGTSTIFALLSTYTQYNNKIKSVMALAPIANLTHTTYFLVRGLLPIANEIKFFMDILQIYEFLPRNFFPIKIMTNTICNENILEPLCDITNYITFGNERGQLNKTREPVYWHHLPAGTSPYTLLHYRQNILAKQFQRYDYGRKKNLKRYGQARPPAFQIERITVPVALFWSQSDRLANIKDVHDLKPRITNLIESYEVPIQRWTHFDFFLAVNAKKYVYDHLLMLLAKM